MIDIFLLTFATMFVVIDPIGLAPITVSLLNGHSFASKRRIIIGAGIISFSILLVFGLVGEAFLHAIGIGMPAFRISGGILLFLTAVEMLFEKRQERRAKSSDDTQNTPQSDPMVFPLSMPLMAGPGAMTSMILLVGNYQGDIASQSVVFLTMALVIIITVMSALLANRFAHIMGDTGTQLINRIFGVLLAALSVQFIADGINAYISAVT